MASTDDSHDSNLRDRPIGELLGRLAQDTSTLVHQELELAKVELTQKGKAAGKGAGMLGGAAIAGLLALGTLTAFLVLVLDKAMPAWLAALIVGILWLAVAGYLASIGRKRLADAAPPKPEQTIETLKEDVEWAKNQK